MGLFRRTQPPDSWEELVQRSRVAVEARQSQFAESIATLQHWHYDLDDGVIDFVGADATVTHRITVLGGTSEVEGTWLWAWANDFPDASLHGLELIQRFGETNGYELMVQPEWPAVEPSMGDVTAVAAQLLNAGGYFRTSGSDVSLYLLIEPSI